MDKWNLSKINLSKINFRRINKDDFTIVIKLLKQLTVVGNISKKDFIEYLDNLEKNINIFVMIVEEDIVGMGSIIIEKKIIHSFGKVGHIEDIVIDDNHRGKGYGKKLVDFLTNYGKDNDCYKIILSCSNENKKFYEKIGYKMESNTMVKRIII